MLLDMARISGRFQRVAEAFDADVARVKPCESSGSEHSPESLTDLSDLVKSFMEKNEREGEGGEDVGVVLQHDEDQEKGDDEEELEKSVTREMLQGLFAGNEADDEDERDAKEKIRREVELACGFVGEYSFPGFKRHLMSRLREIGFDAGLCKSKWQKNGGLTAGDYEYIDVNFSGKRYIVEVSLSAEFDIGRPTNQYSSLLDIFPLIFVGKVEELKRVVKLMSTAIKCSMKRMDLHIPPWRRNGYMQAKWFSSYKRTTNAVATKKEPSHLSSESLFPKRLIGFEARLVKTLNLSNTGFKIGYLTAVFNSDNYDIQL